jgi:hypothetical protein
MRVDELEGLEQTQDLINTAANREIVDAEVAQGALGVDEEGATGVGSVSAVLTDMDDS